MMYQAHVYDQRDELIRSHLDFVDFVVCRMRPQIPVFVSKDELRSAAMHGLMEAAARFDPGRGVMFKTYAETRIRGAIRDELRKMDWFSRSMREKHNRVLREIKQLEQDLGRTPTEEEIAGAMDMELGQYHKMLNEIGHLGIVSLHEVLDGDAGGDTFMDQLEDPRTHSPEDSLGKKELVGMLAGAIDRLTEKERLVVTLFYYEEFTQKEIAGILELSEGRISQLHSQALVKLKATLPQ
ncbi:MAG: FliA/WhiG family RNA polymerase sigma factor [Desulfobacteraceae bacterium]|nr:FliA/WhiG family RNA polymerase sigma factor [Desulfobacteraceae bacterium]